MDKAGVRFGDLPDPIQLTIWKSLGVHPSIGLTGILDREWRRTCVEQHLVDLGVQSRDEISCAMHWAHGHDPGLLEF